MYLGNTHFTARLGRAILMTSVTWALKKTSGRYRTLHPEQAQRGECCLSAPVSTCTFVGI